MNQLYVLLGFFTVLLAILFQIMNSLFGPQAAFLAAAAATVLIVLGTVGITEGLSHDTNFDDLKLHGSVRIRPKDNYEDSTLFEFSPNSSEIYSITGRMHGTIN
jgi:hypothetical protein